ncbi:MAG: lipopolysaccharide biosynthesis protein [Sphingomonas sp.]|nr:lipopolysaccharide biosynthesis protein [Sphingomonas sp.]
MRKALPHLARRAATGSVSLFLRLMSLVGKLALSLYMGRYFALTELGLYGLAFGAVMLAIVLFGFRVDYIVAREIVGMDAAKQRRIGSEVAILYFGSFLLAAPFALGSLLYFGTGGALRLLVLIYLLCGFEAYANFLYTVTIALRRPALANALFFIRSGLWTIPAMAVSFVFPAYRTVEFVIGCWLAGAGASVALNMWFMRARLIGLVPLRWSEWREVRGYCRGAFLVWIGSVAVTLGGYLDRFVLANYLSLKEVGVATFYTSFTTAVITLVQSATSNVTFPTLIEHYDAGRGGAFSREMRKTALIAAAVALVILGGLAVMMPFMGKLMEKPELIAAYPAFLLLLVATLIRTHAETLYYGLFVKRQHKAIWLGNLIFLATSLLLNLILIPQLGLVGLGVAAIASALMILGWRSLALRHRNPLPRRAS